MYFKGHYYEDFAVLGSKHCNKIIAYLFQTRDQQRHHRQLAVYGHRMDGVQTCHADAGITELEKICKEMKTIINNNTTGP